MQITRERILSYLEAHPPSSAGDIGRYLEMTTANIRYHLDILVEEGFVFVSGKRPAGGIGRPILLYTLTSFSLGDNLIPLLAGFLAGMDDSENLDLHLTQIAENLIRGKVEKKKIRVQRFNEAVEFLNTMHYHASWEARPQGPRIELRHCPYQGLAQTHPVLCKLDEKLLCMIFGTELSLIEKRAAGKNPLSPCVFV
jgi:predicted ArsR family transcriptional regulator